MGESDHSNFGPPASISLHLASNSITPAGSVHKSRGDSVVRMWVLLKRWGVSCVWVMQRGHSGDGCDLALTLCKYDLRMGDLFVRSWGRGYLWTKAVITIFLLMNSRPFQMSKPIYVAFSITLVGLVNYMYLRKYSVKKKQNFFSPTACHLPQLHQCRKCVSCRSCRLKVLERLVSIPLSCCL